MTDEESPILIVSDLHLGTKISRAKELMEFLKNMEFGTLILNGDILDCPNLKLLKADHWKFFLMLKGFLKSGKRVIWVAGNHDSFAKPLFKAFGIKTATHYVFEWHKIKCLAVHGHQYDKFLIKNGVVSSTFNKSYRAIQKLDGKKQNVSRFMKKRYKLWLRISKRVAKGAAEYAQLKEAQYVFCGHTHEAMTMKMGKVTYYNCGSWADRPCHYIFLNGGEVKIGAVEV